MNHESKIVILTIGLPNSDSAKAAELPEKATYGRCGKSEFAIRAPVSDTYQMGESPIQSYVKLCS
jgi:hypothetical protein